MKTFFIINKQTLQIEFSYEALEASPARYKHAWNPLEHLHTELPNGMLLGAVQIDSIEGNEVQISENSVKKIEVIAANRLYNLNSLRAQRDEKLKRVDQLVNIAFLNSWTAGEKTELKNYRQELLNITEPYKADMSLCDSMNVEWPLEPSES